ncbi:hypothetical protein B0T18DRAFT_400195 [Schizothecium vesticola]|uniref:Uncharacterized protein n=1 Tax=Schizothecium vesticola TaxID=314040 RepID=A0AA40FBZ2_9PEZI|nr:hypothetical protein B0T18DRAFT_400195 [Schizothecium vesticola]
MTYSSEKSRGSGCCHHKHRSPDDIHSHSHNGRHRSWNDNCGACVRHCYKNLRSSRSDGMR